MNITWYGQTCFRLISQKGKNGPINILIDPLIKESGFRSPKLAADILLFTSSIDKKISSEEHFLITDPGEYDVKGVYVQGIPAQTKKKGGVSEKVTVYTVETEEMKICHLGKLGQEELNTEQLEKIGEVDILMIPIGNREAISCREAIKIMAQIEPKIIIPMYYQIPKLKEKLDGLDKFLKALGIKSLEPLAKLSIKKRDIAKDEARIVVLGP